MCSLDIRRLDACVQNTNDYHVYFKDWWRRDLSTMVRRSLNHPSIVMWDGCNECQVKMGTDTEVYATFVMTVVAQEDKTRAVWPSCPALGWTGGVNRLTSIPNGKNLTTPDSGNRLETHGPYQVRLVVLISPFIPCGFWSLRAPSGEIILRLLLDFGDGF